jgi:hypothetical protein
MEVVLGRQHNRDFGPPVVGSFENNVGHFFARDTFNGKPIIMMFALGRPRQRASNLEPGIFAGQWENMGMELVQRVRRKLNKDAGQPPRRHSVILPEGNELLVPVN